METSKLTYEQALEQLENILALLDNGELPLEQGIELFQKGLEMVKICNMRLEDAEGKMKVLRNGEFREISSHE